MPQQPESSTPPPQGPVLDFAPPPPGAALPPRAVEPHHEHKIPRWLERSELFLRVLLRMYIGIAICCAPWLPMFWDRNPLLLHFPTVALYAANGAVRGVVSGLGLLNLWIAFQEAIHHWDK